MLVCTAGDLVEPDPGLRAFWQEEGRLLEAGDVDGATELNVATWLGPDTDDDEARFLVRIMQRAGFDHQLAAGDVDDRELPVNPEVLVMPVTMIVGARSLRLGTTRQRRPARVSTARPGLGRLRMRVTARASREVRQEAPCRISRCLERR